MKKSPTNLEILQKAFKAKRNNAEALAAVLKVHPHSKMSLSTVNWYRNKYRREGMPIPSEHSLR